jgi:3-hydroxyacyl-[acyl-carrier-protein] dehydratase
MSEMKSESTEMDINEIMERIPHRHPFLFVDKVRSFNETEGWIVAEKTVSIEEPFFAGHFPDKPIMPGVLIIEALAQVGAILISLRGMEGLKVLVGVSNFKFRRPVYPGDTLILELETTHISSVGGRSKGVASVNGKKCAEGEMIFSVFKEKKEHC